MIHILQRTFFHPSLVEFDKLEFEDPFQIKIKEIIFFFQLVPAVLVLLPGFTGGAAISYGAVALPHYMDPDNDSGLVMTKDQATWFSKSPPIFLSDHDLTMT